MIRQNLEAQQSVLGVLIADAVTTAPEIIARLNAQDFILPEHRSIFEAAKQLYRDGKPIDPITVLAETSPDYKTVIANCVDAAPTLSNFREYIEIVKADALRRKAYEQLEDLTELIAIGEPVQDCQKAAAAVCETLNDTGTEKTISAKELYYLFFDTKSKPKEYFKTGFLNLDKRIYLDRGDYMIVGGRPSSGKTAFTLQLAAKMAEKHNVVYFSLETSAAKIGDRLMAYLSNTPLSEIKTAQIKDWGKVNEARESFERLSLHIVEASGWTVEQIRAKAVQLKADIIFIDYLSLIQGEGKSIYERVTNISRELHIFAQQTRIAVVALSQLSREGKGEPDMTHLRESGQLEQDADVILLLHNTNTEQENADRKLIVAKNKEGSTGAILLSFQGAYQRFIEIEVRR